MTRGAVTGPVALLHLWTVASLVALAGAVARDQGVADTKAHVGRIFRLQIPDNAFEGHVEKLEVTEAGESSLPAWLQFDSKRKVFEGVPSSTDSGQLYICIKAIDGAAVAKDVFSIEVTEDAPTDVYCLFGNEETMAAIVLDATLSEMKPPEKFRILESIASHLDIPETRFRLSPLRRDESVFDPSAVRAGPGNAVLRTNEGTQLQFRVGCSGEVAPEFESVIATLEKSASNGELADLVGCMVVGWQVSGASKQPVAHLRDRRNVTPFLHATPVPKIHITRWPTYTERVDETREMVPFRRIIPTMVSPRYIDRTTYDHRHRHHHGQDPLRREHILRTTEILASPTYRFHPFPTTKHASGGTPLPTPVLYPERPTTVIMPTRVFEVDMTASIMRPPFHASEDVLSRWYVPSSEVTTADISAVPPSRPVVEPTKLMSQIPNFKPTVNSRTKKLSLVAGKAWSYTIPMDTFIDMEDGNTRDLKLIFMTAERASLLSSSWIQFDPENQVIYALPLNDNVGKHEFVLEAMDSKGASTFDRVELHVWHHPQIDSLTHSFSMTVRYKKWQYPVGIDWQIEILNRIARLMNDSDNSKLRLLSVTMDPSKIAWTNDTLPTEECPGEVIREIYETISTNEHHPTKEMKKLMGAEFRVQDINVRYHGSCQGIITTPPPPLKFAPILRNSIGRINVTVGDVIKFKIPENTFYDFEDGGTRRLRLTLLTSDNVEPLMSSWLQFDSGSQEIYGLPSDTDIGMHSYSLNAMDSDDQTVENTFIIHVSRLTRRKKPPVEFSIQLDYDYDQFQSDTNQKTLVATKIARLYGDPDPRYIIVNNITRGSVVYGWGNKTLTGDDCPINQINHLIRYIISDDGNVSSNLIQVMEPEFRVIGADAKPVGICVGTWKPSFVTTIITTSRGTTIQPPSLPPGEVEPTLKTSTDEDIYITTIVPAIVIAVMLVIAAIIAYFLYWRKRKGKMSLGEKDFIGSGVPVVFAGELEEQKPDLGKAPAVLKNERPPLSTDYLLNNFRRGTAAVRDSVLATSAKTRDDPPLRQESSSTLYKPPPPFPSSREPKHMRPKSTQAQAYRHATYVPP